MAKAASAQPTTTGPLFTFVATRDFHGRPHEFYNDIPARDLTAKDVAGLSAEKLEMVRRSHLYKAVEPETPAAAKPKGASGADPT